MSPTNIEVGVISEKDKKFKKLTPE